MDIARLGIQIRYHLNPVHIGDLTGPHQEAQLRTYQVCNRDIARSFVQQQLLKGSNSRSSETLASTHYSRLLGGRQGCRKQANNGRPRRPLEFFEWYVLSASEP